MTELLAVYLRDHHAGAQAGTALSKRAAEHVRVAGARGGELAAVAAEIADELRLLESMMERLDISPSAVKDSIAAAGERIGRLKGNGSVLKRSPLSDVVELEALLAGITAKSAMWRALLQLTDSVEALDGDELRALEEQAHRQLEVVDACRLEAARVAFGGRPQAAAV
jgi:hypothetical protein